MKIRLLITHAIAVTALAIPVTLADGPSPVRSFGPTGLEISLQKDNTLKVTAVQEGSPAAGKLTKDRIITAINGEKIESEFIAHRKQLGDAITRAEATDGHITLTTKTGKVTLTLPVLGNFSDTWPLHCPKTDKVVAANAAYLRGLALKGELSDHDMNDAMGLLSLLSTGTDEDLTAVREAYRKRMEGFSPDKIGSHSWHNGYSGIAACEYYLRTGDKSVMPLIDAICEAARKWQVQGAWTHWAQGVNPQYVGGGLLNAAGTNLCTTLLLAKQCGAKVDEKAMLSSLEFFYRFAGHGANPYGDHRPESGYGSNNGKSEQLAMAMQAASRAANGKVYGMARDKNAQTTLYAYRFMLGGHTGPIGTLWYGPAASLMADKKPALFRNRMNEIRWWYELSRQHDGSFVISSAARYDNPEYGRAMLLGLTGPRKTLQITGAPKSKFAVPFTLPDQIWGRPSDLAFFDLNGSPDYKSLDPVPHVEYDQIVDATEEELRSLAGHPEHIYREAVAAELRDDGHFDLIEQLLTSESPLERHTACLAINDFQSWELRYSKGWASGKSIAPEKFTPAMFKHLMAMVENPDEALWLVDSAFKALVLAKPEQTISRLDTLIPWLKHAEWWLQQSSAMALSPALSDVKSAARILPEMGGMIAKMDHNKPRGALLYLLGQNLNRLPPAARKQAASMMVGIYQKTPNQESIDGEMDKSGITSVNLASTLSAALAMDPTLAPELAMLSVKRLDDMRERERNEQIDLLIEAGMKLDDAGRRKIGKILKDHYRTAIYKENAEVLSPDFKGYLKSRITPLNKVLAIDELCGIDGSWKIPGKYPGGRQQWMFTSFEPKETRDHADKDRRRDVTLPDHLEGWFQTDYDTAAKGWKSYSAPIGDKAPDSHRNQPAWKAVAPESAGEVIFIRKTFEVEDLDQEIFRLVTYSRQGYTVYINGQLVVDQKGRSKNWWPRITYDEEGKIRKALRKGTNVLAATSFLQYFNDKEGDLEVFLEALKALPKPN